MIAVGCWAAVITWGVVFGALIVRDLLRGDETDD